MINSSSIQSNSVVSRVTSTIASSSYVNKANSSVFSTIATSDDSIVASTEVFQTYDVKLRQICDHKLSNKQYKINECPRCLGTSIYYDIFFSDAGNVLTVQYEDSLVQGLEKIVLTERNPFHPNYAANIKKNLGQLTTAELKTVIKNDIVNALVQFRESQKTTANLSNRAKIDTLDSISVDDVDISSLKYQVFLTTISGSHYKLAGIVQL